MMKSLNCARKTFRNWARHAKTGSCFYENTIENRPLNIGLGRMKMLTLRGKGVSPGMAQGKAFVYKDVLLRDSELYLIDDSQIDEEKTRIQGAVVINPSRQALQKHNKAIDEGRKRREAMVGVNTAQRRADRGSASKFRSMRQRPQIVQDVELAMQCGADGIGLFRNRTVLIFRPNIYLRTEAVLQRSLGTASIPSTRKAYR